MKKFAQCIQNVNQNVSPKETILAIKNAGFDSTFVQWYNKDWEFSQQQQIDLCNSLGLKIEFAHLGYQFINDIWIDDKKGDELADSYLRDLDSCKKNNINLVIMHLSSKSIAPKPSLIGIKRLQKIVDYAEGLGIKIAFENNKIFGYLEYVFDHIKNSNIGICFDSGHCHCHFDDIFDWERFKGKIYAVHLHDNDKSDDQHLLPFDGTIDWSDLMKKLKDSEYNGPITLESCYRNQYLDMSVEEFYKLSLERAKML